MMKKRSLQIISICILIALTFSLSACTGKNKSTELTEGGKMPESILISGGPSGGNWYAMGASFSEALTRAGAKSSAIPGGGTQNIIAVGDGHADLGFSNLFSLDAAYKAQDPYTREYTDVIALMALDTNLIYFIVPKDSDIKTISDLKGKIIASPNAGTSAQMCIFDAFKAAGIDPEKDLTLKPGSMSESGELLKDRLVDAYLITTGVSNSTIMDLTTSLDVNILSLGEDVIQGMLNMNPGYRKLTLPANTYKGQTEDVLTVTSDAALIVNKNKSEDEVYWITKAIVENFDYIKTANGWLRDVTIESMANAGQFEIHPGAMKYFNEVLGK